jgi:LemA protein
MKSAVETPDQRMRRTHSSFNWSGGMLALLILGSFALAIGIWTASIYNDLVRADQDVRSRWAQVENAYQRRADLIPNLVQTVKGAANFESKTFTDVAEARARVGQVSAQDLQRALENRESFDRFEAAQESLRNSLSRLLVVSEQYPQLRATENFRDLQAQLEGAENRIAVERMRFNESARNFNSLRNKFPDVLIANSFGDRFAEKPFFKAAPGSETAPKVNF